MQQTQTYKLNKPGIDDPLAIAPLNENADTLERELTRVDTEKAALDARVTVLEADKVRLILGSYVGSGKNDKETQNVQLGTTPKAVFFPNGGRSPYMIVPGTPIFDSYCNMNIAEIVEGGFQVVRDRHSDFNINGTTYHFLALV